METGARADVAYMIDQSNNLKDPIEDLLQADRLMAGDRPDPVGLLLVALATAGWALDRDVPELGRTLGEELLEPTRIYAKACLELAARTRTHAMSHVTGGGLAANLERVMPEELTATIERGTWTPQPIFDVVRRVGAVPQADGSQKAVEVHIFPEAMRGTGEGHRPWDLQPGSTMTNASVEKIEQVAVEKVQGQMLTLKYKDGEQKIFVPPGTPIVRNVAGDRSPGHRRPRLAHPAMRHRGHRGPGPPRSARRPAPPVAARFRLGGHGAFA